VIIPFCQRLAGLPEVQALSLTYIYRAPFRDIVAETLIEPSRAQRNAQFRLHAPSCPSLFSKSRISAPPNPRCWNFGWTKTPRISLPTTVPVAIISPCCTTTNISPFRCRSRIIPSEWNSSKNFTARGGLLPNSRHQWSCELAA
jgi:hypothetical protein